MAIDIEEELTEHDSDLSRRAARYIRLKRLEIDGLRRELRSVCELGNNLMTQASPETQATEYRHCEHGKPAGTSPCPTCYPAAEPSAPFHNCNCIGSCKGPFYGSRCRQL
jgi:hypothetical protein